MHKKPNVGQSNLSRPKRYPFISEVDCASWANGHVNISNAEEEEGSIREGKNKVKNKDKVSVNAQERKS